MHSNSETWPEQDASFAAHDGADLTSTAPLPNEGLIALSRRTRASDAVLLKMLPLVKLLDTIQPHVASESVFRTRRKKIQAHLAVVRAELHAPRPKHKVLTHAFQVLTELVREETHDISKNEVKQAAKEVVLATLQHAPALINVAHQARLLS
jgi:hypothetical protein